MFYWLGEFGSLFFDPSGTVFSTNGAPVPGATVVLEQAPTQYGLFTVLPGASPGIQPHVNPEVTGKTGQFHWDVIADYYKVVASAPSCHAPGDPAESTVETPVMSVPPPRFGLDLVLQCAHPAAPVHPSVISLSAGEVAQPGGAQVEVVGDGFTPAAKVIFGPRASPSVTYLSPELLMATTPPGEGEVHVLVRTAGGTSSPTAAGVIDYLPVPAVTSVSPSTGPPAGGTRVDIVGSGFSGATTVLVGSRNAANFRVVSPTLIVATVPPGRLGSVNITVPNSVAKSKATPADRFTYARPRARGKQ